MRRVFILNNNFLLLLLISEKIYETSFEGINNANKIFLTAKYFDRHVFHEKEKTFDDL